MNLTNISVIRELMLKYGVKFSKNLGQNFLINPGICPKMSDFAKKFQLKNVIEIGPGIGVLTAELAQNFEKVLAVEIDSKLLPILKETVGNFGNVTVLNSDILKLNINSLISQYFGDSDVCVCANLPYYITTPVIMHLLTENSKIKNITVMVQKEVAERLSALPATPQSSAITVAVNYYGSCKKLFNVSRGSFEPKPNVDSAVIQIIAEKGYNLAPKEEKDFFKIVKAAFANRRKTFVNSVSIMLNIPKNTISGILKMLNISENARAEELTVLQFINISKKIFA